VAIIQCIECSKEFNVVPARLPTAKFCSYACRGRWRTKHWSGHNNPAFNASEPRAKVCGYCGHEFGQKANESIAYFRVRKFCSRECSRKGQRYRCGPEHPLFKPDSRRKNRRGKHGAWARAVISRDHATCQRCGATGVELHAHHIKPFVDHPGLRWDIDNGLTLCYQCHWLEHTASNANGVNSGNIPPGKAEDNPEPSFGRKPVEGVTTRGRAYRRWMGSCEECGTFLSKRWSDVAGRANIFCSKTCAAKFKGRRSRGVPRNSHGSNASTSAPPERDDIV
jgi:hypothetical protein